MDLHALLCQNADIILALDGLVRLRGHGEQSEMERHLATQAFDNIAAIALRMAPKVLEGPPELMQGLKACRHRHLKLEPDHSAAALPDRRTVATLEQQQPATQPMVPRPPQQAVVAASPEATDCTEVTFAPQPSAEVHAAVAAAPSASSGPAPSMQQRALQMTEQDGSIAAVASLETVFKGADSLHSLPSFRSWGGGHKGRSQGEG